MAHLVKVRRAAQGGPHPPVVPEQGILGHPGAQAGHAPGNLVGGPLEAVIAAKALGIVFYGVLALEIKVRPRRGRPLPQVQCKVGLVQPVRQARIAAQCEAPRLEIARISPVQAAGRVDGVP